MTTLEVHAGDFLSASFHKAGFGGPARLRLDPKAAEGRPEEISLSELESLEVIKREKAASATAKLTRVLVGGALGGPAGLAASAMFAATRRSTASVMFEARLRDGRRLLASTDHKTFLDIQEAKFGFGDDDVMLEPGDHSTEASPSGRPEDIPWAPDYLRQAPGKAAKSAEAAPPTASGPDVRSPAAAARTPRSFGKRGR